MKEPIIQVLILEYAWLGKLAAYCCRRRQWSEPLPPNALKRQAFVLVGPGALKHKALVLPGAVATTG